MTIKFPDAIKELNFKQFIEVCKFFDVRVVDRESVKLEDNSPTSVAAAAKNAHARRDFEEMTNELVESYTSLPRERRRKIDRIVDKIVRANRTARKLMREKVEESYAAGAANLDEVLNVIATEGEDNG